MAGPLSHLWVAHWLPQMEDFLCFQKQKQMIDRIVWICCCVSIIKGSNMFIITRLLYQISGLHDCKIRCQDYKITGLHNQVHIKCDWTHIHHIQHQNLHKTRWLNHVKIIFLNTWSRWITMVCKKGRARREGWYPAASDISWCDNNSVHKVPHKQFITNMDRFGDVAFMLAKLSL